MFLGSAAFCQAASVPVFEPFRALRYDLDVVDMADVAAPPYDVIDDRDRAELVARHPNNAVRIDLPIDENDEDRYAVACRLLSEWQAAGVLKRDDRPAFTIYRMAFVDDRGTPRHTTGVLGALELSRPDRGEILPHEHTTKKAKSDRLDMLRSCRGNLSAIWSLSLAKGLTDLLPIDTTPDTEWTDDDGVTHTVWTTDDPEVCDAITEAVGSQPVLIADGHHRYETSLAYRDEQRDSNGGDAGGAERTLMYVVELVEDELTVRPIHRLLNGLPDGIDLAAALADSFTISDAGPIDDTITSRMESQGALCLIEPDRARFLVPRSDALDDKLDLDSIRLDAARASLPEHEVTFQHGVDRVVDAVKTGRAQAGVLLRPATVAQIEATGHGGERMPAKTTFFHPKVKTGIVFHLFDEA